MEGKNVYLHIPDISELWYRQHLMSDAETMSYNRGYEAFVGYDRDTGCIAFPESEWEEWYQYFIGNEPKRFCAYIVRKEDGAFIGEVNLHESSEHDWHEMGIVIEAKYRGKGYAKIALRQLIEYGFEQMKVKAIHNIFETERMAAIRTHLAAGFREYARDDGMVEFLITAKEYVGEN